jgi:hypothetical protein
MMRLHTNGTRRCPQLTLLFPASQDAQDAADAANRVDAGRVSIEDLLAAVHALDPGGLALHLRVGIAAFGFA